MDVTVTVATVSATSSSERSCQYLLLYGDLPDAPAKKHHVNLITVRLRHSRGSRSRRRLIIVHSATPWFTRS